MSVSLRMLLLIRWVAVLGQAVTLLVVNFGLGYALPILPAMAVVAAPRHDFLTRLGIKTLAGREAALGYTIVGVVYLFFICFVFGPILLAFSLSFEQVIELTRLLVSQVKSVLPGARTLITVTHPFGEYHARGKTSVPPLLYAEMVAQSGINFEAFALEVEMGVPEPGNW